MTTKPTSPQDGQPAIVTQVFQRSDADPREYAWLRLTADEFAQYEALRDGVPPDATT